MCMAPNKNPERHPSGRLKKPRQSRRMRALHKRRVWNDWDRFLSAVQAVVQ